MTKDYDHNRFHTTPANPLQTQLINLLRSPNPNRAEAEDLYLRLVATRAWQLAQAGFRDEGRGALLFDMRGRLWPSVLAQPLDSYFVPQLLLAQADEELDPMLEIAVASYDPRHEFVCVVLYDEGPSVSRLSQRDLAA
ncbi:MAG: hypothetical protein MUD01_19345 [Chloroflexaceae bacterium]|jgi:hypothetical protein|nr:hypothetical protein [Chloroflexaceae bacterium]